MTTGVITLSVICFCLETTPELKPYIWGKMDGLRLKLSRGTSLNYIDVVSILPWYFELMTRLAKEEAADDAGMFKLIKLFRVLRVLKLRFDTIYCNLHVGAPHLILHQAALLIILYILAIIFSSSMFPT